jgi:uncharacterized protein (TIGR02145 family)
MRRRNLIVMTAFLCCIALVSCKKNDIKPDNYNGNTENPGGGGGNQQNPSTAVIIHNAVTDYDGNSYDAVQLGNQIWMAENLHTTHFANGAAIPVGPSDYSPSRCTPPNGDANTYGYLYNWPAVVYGSNGSAANPSGVQGVCPTGWHVPSDAEWTQMTDYVGNQSEFVCNSSSNSIAKALASDHGWQMSGGNECAVCYDQSTNNATGFSAFPVGRNFSESFDGFGNIAYFWTATKSSGNNVYYRYISAQNTSVESFDSFMYGYGYSVRCVKD